MNTQTMKVQYRGGYSKPWDSPSNSPGLYRTNPVNGEVTFHSQYWKAGAPDDCMVDELVDTETGEEIDLREEYADDTAEWISIYGDPRA